MPHEPLFRPLTIGEITIPNRVVMAPLTRSRAEQPGDIPGAMNAEYYRQRAGMGLIVSEATYVSLVGRAYGEIPGIVTDEQVAGWRRVTDAVHEAGGRIFLQLIHGGRIGHKDLTGGATPVAPSAIRAESQTYIKGGAGKIAVEEPRALETDEIPGVVREFADAARRAIEAGFDGVEIHGANGYLVDQFTRDGSNRRTDAFGGSLENRLRFPVEVARAVAEAIGAARTGYRISPGNEFNSMSDSDPIATFSALGRALGGLGLAYLHAAEIGPDRSMTREATDASFTAFKEAGGGATIANCGYTGETASARIADDGADAVAFGVLAIANPDLAERLRVGASLNDPDQSTFYGGGAEGYTDYPALAATAT